MCKYRVSFGNEIFENKVGQDSSLISNTSESDFFKFSIKLLLDKSYTYRRFSIVQVSLTTIHVCYLKLTSLLLAIFAKLKIFLYLLIFGVRPGYSIQTLLFIFCKRLLVTIILATAFPFSKFAISGDTKNLGAIFASTTRHQRFFFSIFYFSIILNILFEK